MTIEDVWPSLHLAATAADMPDNPDRLAQVMGRRHRQRRRTVVVVAVVVVAVVVVAGVAAVAVVGRSQARGVRVATTVPVTVGSLVTTSGVSASTTAAEAQDDLVRQLRHHGLIATIGGPVDQLFLHAAHGWIVHVQGPTLLRPADLQVYQYDSAGAAAADARRFRPDGSIEDQLPNGNIRRVVPLWIAPPHIYQAGPLLVIYTGTDTALLTTLVTILGAPRVG